MIMILVLQMITLMIESNINMIMMMTYHDNDDDDDLVNNGEYDDDDYRSGVRCSKLN